jgi:hypothetical protein
MSERQTQNKFLRELIESEECAQCIELQARITQTQRDESCSRSAVNLAVVLALLSLLGLGYTRVLSPDSFDNSLILKTFTAIFVASTISVVGFIGFWWHYRNVCNAAYEEVRRFIRSNHKPTSPAPNPVVSVPSAEFDSPQAQLSTVRLG